MRMLNFALTAMMLAGIGCRTVNSTERSRPIGEGKIVDDSRIETNPITSATAQILGVHESVVSGDLTKIQVDVYNRHPWTGRFDYKFEWYDNDGMMVDSPLSIWTSREIQGHEQISLIGVSPSPRAKDFRLKLQEHKGN